MTESKSVALPLGYTPSFVKKMASPQGFEPRTHGLEGRCSIQLSYEPLLKLERMMRIELTPSAWKAEVLPLNYIRKLERKTRFELATLALARRCSTPEPLPHIIGRGRWIRTTESSANGFTVRPLWPLGNPSIKVTWTLYQMFYQMSSTFLTFLLELVEGIEPPTC